MLFYCHMLDHIKGQTMVIWILEYKFPYFESRMVVAVNIRFISLLFLVFNMLLQYRFFTKKKYLTIVISYTIVIYWSIFYI